MLLKQTNITLNCTCTKSKSKVAAVKKHHMLSSFSILTKVLLYYMWMSGDLNHYSQSYQLFLKVKYYI